MSILQSSKEPSKRRLERVIVEAASSLLSEPSSLDILDEERSRAVLRVTELSVKDAHNGEASVQTDEVSKSQGTHRHVGTELHSGINVLLGTQGLGESDDGLVDVGHEKTVGDETRHVLRLSSSLFHGLSERKSSLEGFIGGLEARDDLNQLHDGNRVHEMHTNDLIRTVSSSSNLRDGDRRGVGGQDDIRRDDFGKISEDLILQNRVLSDGFNNKVGLSELIHTSSSNNAAHSFHAHAILEFALRNLLLHIRVCSSLKINLVSDIQQ